ncbi:hypothetical protein CRE_13722 [Caenorhabditis remanei]|uniref:G-protein coupled receptors family 1 profile domain-containing protein n=1 Tax=Caenorhabditis remanei TaxID=31234 RepID=E3NBR9_CAERE|nr:hypothetical protein CRE_13722 [Caenorhabditis remanei]
MDLLNTTISSHLEMESTSGNVTDVVEDYCHYEVLQPHMLVMRFWMVSIFGSTISFISMIENIFLFWLFVTSRRHRRENLFMMLLAFFDIFVSMAYIMLMSVNVLSDVLMSPVLVSVWYTYMIPILTVSHIAMTSSSFLIVAASFERYCATLNSPYLRFAQRNRSFLALCAVFLGVVSKGTISIEFELVHHEQCIGQMMATTMKFRPFVFETQYHYLFRFWYRNFVTVFAPFFILLYLNIRIVKALTTYTTATVCLVTNGNSEDLQKRKASARAATRTLVMVGCCYIVSNIINVILTSLEQTNNELADDHPDIYIVLIDLVSLLTTMACAARLPIYLYCQPVLRREIFLRFKRLCVPCSSSSPEKLGERLKSVETDTSFLSRGEATNSECIPISEVTGAKKSPTKCCLHSPYETLL